MNLDFLPQLHGLISMIPGGDLIWTILMFIVVLSVLVFFHEWGHYLAARSVGVIVKSFSIGFGKEIKGWTDTHGTRWKISLIPLGGYVKMAGDDVTEEVEEHEAHGAFLRKHALERIWVVVAGPLANFLLAIVVLSALFMAGEKVSRPLEELAPVIGVMNPEMPAAQAGIQIGDKITAVNGQQVANYAQLRDIIAVNAGKKTAVNVNRDNQNMTMTIIPKPLNVLDENGNEITAGKIGVGPTQEFSEVKHSPVDAVLLATERTYDYSLLILSTVWKMISGKVSADNVGGPIMIAEMASASAKQGGYWLLFFTAIISINLGLINLFPIPMLDGGHLLYYTAELIKGSPVGEKAQLIGHRFGVAVIGLLFVFVFYNDIMRLLERL